MQVFLSWSGDRSRELANALREYLPMVIQSVTPWFSPDDIDKGSRWLADLTSQLQKQSVAIVCVTPECVNSPWLLFEAGALSKALDASWVCPILLDIEPSDIKGPLAQFQSTRVTKDDMRKLLATLNRRLESPLADIQLDKLHNIMWDDFEKKIKSIVKPSAATAPLHRSQNDLLVEVLERVRGLERKIFNSEVPQGCLGKSFWESSGLNVKGRQHLANHNDLLEKTKKIRHLYESTLKRVSMLEADLAVLSDIDSERYISLQAELDKERSKLLSYEAELGRGNAKLDRFREYHMR